MVLMMPSMRRNLTNSHCYALGATSCSTLLDACYPRWNSHVPVCHERSTSLRHSRLCLRSESKCKKLVIGSIEAFHTVKVRCRLENILAATQSSLQSEGLQLGLQQAKDISIAHPQ
jgi:hypothetical protein